MKVIQVQVNGKEYIFRTNDNGNGLFTGVGENRQVSDESGFHDAARMKREIRAYLVAKLGREKVSRIKYRLGRGWEA